VVSINSLRADHLSCYGYERNTTPHICDVAADGTRYTRAYSQFHWTTPSEASIQSGLCPAVHGVKHPDDGPSELPSTMTMPEQLAAAGYGTHGIFVRDNWTYRNDTGMQRGFEEVHSAGSLDPHRITDWLRSPGPDLVYTLPMELHRPYTHDWVRPGDQYTAGYNGTLARFWDADGDLPGGCCTTTPWVRMGSGPGTGVRSSSSLRKIPHTCAGSMTPCSVTSMPGSGVSSVT